MVMLQKVIRESDVVTAVMGINQSIEREGQDRSSIELPKDQQIFTREAYKANPNTIVVLVAVKLHGNRMDGSEYTGYH